MLCLKTYWWSYNMKSVHRTTLILHKTIRFLTVQIWNDGFHSPKHLAFLQSLLTSDKDEVKQQQEKECSCIHQLYAFADQTENSKIYKGNSVSNHINSYRKHILLIFKSSISKPQLASTIQTLSHNPTMQWHGGDIYTFRHSDSSINTA